MGVTWVDVNVRSTKTFLGVVCCVFGACTWVWVIQERESSDQSSVIEEVDIERFRSSESVSENEGRPVGPSTLGPEERQTVRSGSDQAGSNPTAAGMAGSDSPRLVSQEAQSEATHPPSLTGSSLNRSGSPEPSAWKDRVPDPTQIELPAHLTEFPQLEDILSADLSEQEVTQHYLAELGEQILAGVTPKERRTLVNAIEVIEASAMKQTLARAEVLGLDVSGTRPSGASFQLVAFHQGKPLYMQTENEDAAVSSAASYVRQNSAFSSQFGGDIDGSGFYFNVNDFGVVRQHAEFQLPNGGGSRLIEREAPNADDHPDHVAGTIGAHGYNPDIKGMAPAVRIYAMNQQSTSDIYHLGMTYPHEPRKSIGGNTSLGGPNVSEGGGGIYSSSDRNFDNAVLATPYYLHFYSAGNSGNGGFDTITSSSKEAKNIMTVANARDLNRDANGNPTQTIQIWGSSSRGPTDDGRIKPDITGNGYQLTSTVGTGTSTKTFTGTSMSSPNTAGSSILLQDYFSKRFPGHLMRANTLKNLILHTADEAGNTGPDYTFGWGYMNTLRAAELIRDYADNPGNLQMMEAILEDGGTHTFTYQWDGTSPIKVTLSWEDAPPTFYTSSNEDRTPDLLNDLDVRVSAPSATVHLPWAMPYVLNGFQSSDYDAPATRADNTTDNVEQVFINTPTEAGVYTVTISHKGNLITSSGDSVDGQRYSLMVSGMSQAVAAPAPTITSFTPDQGYHHHTLVTVTGQNFLLGANVEFHAPGLPVIEGQSEMVTPDKIEVRMPLDLQEAGQYSVVVINPDGQSGTSATDFTVPHYQDVLDEDFEDGFTFSGAGWSTGADQGISEWSVTTSDAVSGSHSAFVPGTTTETDSHLITPTIPVPATSDDIVLTFLHRYAFQIRLSSGHNGQDGGLLEIQVNGGSWVDTDGLQGVQFHAGDYVDNLHSTNAMGYQSSAWTDHTDGFIRTTVSLDGSIYGEKNIRFRWRMGTDNAIAEEGWWLDDVNLRVKADNELPQVSTTPASVATVGQAYGETLTFTDPENDALTLSVVSKPAWLTFTDNGDRSGSFSGTPSAGDVGTQTVTLEANDGSGIRSYSFSLTVVPAGGNTPPAFTTTSLDPAILEEPYSFTLVASDADGHRLKISVDGLPSWLGFVDHGDGTATLTGEPSVYHEVTHTMSFTVYDGVDSISQNLDLQVAPKAQVSLASATRSVSEGAGIIELTVSRSVSALGEVSVQVATSNNGATAGSDYTSVSQTLTWPAGDVSTRTVTVPITDDNLVEPSENFRVTLSGPSGPVEVGTLSVTTVTITDNEVNPPGTVTLTAPAEGLNFVRGKTLTLTADASDPQGVKRVEFWKDGSKLGEDTSAPYMYTWSQAWDDSSQLVARLVDQVDAVQDSAPVSISSTLGTLPGVWTAEDIGNVQAVGNSSYDSSMDAYYLRGSGANIKDASDEFHFLHQPFSGDGEILARITAYDYSSNRAKVGIMIRGSTDANAPFAMVNIRNRDGGDIEFARRTSAGANSTRNDDGHNYSPLPIWARITRTGNVFTAFYSENGTDWTEIGSQTIVMDPSVVAGLCVTARSDGNYARGSFDQVLVTSGGNLPPVVTIDSPGASPVKVNQTGVWLELEATATDDEPLTYSWTQEEGPAGGTSFLNADAEDAQVRFSQPGTYLLRLTASDDTYSEYAEVSISVGTVTPPADPLIHYALDEGSGNTAANSGSEANADAARSGDVSFGASGPTGTAAAFGGGGGDIRSVNAGQALGGLTALTASVWYYAEASMVNTDGGILESTNPGGSSNNNSGVFTIRFDDKGWFSTPANSSENHLTIGLATSDGTVQYYTAEGTMDSGQWHHLVFVWESGSLPKVYLDGEEDSPTINGKAVNGSFTQGAISNGTVSLPDMLVLGRQFRDETNTSWEGALDDVQIYSRALTASEISALYQQYASFGGNIAPELTAGEEATVQRTGTPSLAGLVSDPDSNPGTLSSSWSKVSGPGEVTFGDSSDPASTVGFSTTGVYLLRLTVTDGDVTLYDEVTITVEEGYVRHNQIPDDWETVHFPNQDTPATVTKNGKQVDIVTAYTWGLDPTDSSAVLSVQADRTVSGFQVDVQTVSNRQYAVERCTDLTADPPVWSPVGGEVTGDGSSHQVTDPSPPDYAVYRIRIWVPDP